MAPPLSIADVHVWMFGIDRPDRFEACVEALPADEQARVRRFHFDEHRIRYAAAHGIARHILGRYLGAYEAASFVTGPRGKPALAGASLRFNLSHSADMGMLAVARETEVGVDIEALNRTVEVRSLATQFFSPAERDRLLALPEAATVPGFFHLWTQKEAYLKGRGDGVTDGLDHFDTEADPDRPAALLADRRDPSALLAWRLRSLQAPTGFRATLAVRAPDPRVRQFEIA